MKIGIIGAGHIGSTLAKLLVQQGHTVLIANSRGPQTLKQVQEETKAKPVELLEIVQEGDLDIIILTIPFKNVSLLPKNLFQNLPQQVIVVDTCNYYPGVRDSPTDELDKEIITHSEWVSQQIGHSVVKVFNNILTHSLAVKGAKKGQTRIALPVAGNDPSKKKVILDLVDQLGFDPVDSGTLDESWRQHPATPSYCTDLNVDDLKQALHSADKTIRVQLLSQAFSQYGKVHLAYCEKHGKDATKFTFQDLLDEGGDEINDIVVNINRSLYQ
ncbi:predicted protein [Naegleria gruberi]|uniref:Predicted protein n=1 Tax=Naegleria gruberi TaxID=5762 RepID=D2W380_NAEGR|nr:uncharacterized protein NAEGRDRAFT_75850 [Naegleria gruberi]EFC36443.1 predicted protein [Naegleria gruberi]|eukprot:XP_002669187.1 predicted protein [Naegleria gruberi strain NEG-M]